MSDPVERFHPRMPPSTAFGLKSFAERGFDISVGAYTYGTPTVHWAEPEKQKYALKIGSFCSIAAEVSVYVGTQGIHSLDFVSTYPIGMVFGLVPGAEKPAGHEGDLGVTIGSDVWVGRNALIQSGVTIGHGAVIGSRAVVTADVEPYTIVAGIPARPLRKRFTEPQIARLLALHWWDWPEDRIRGALAAFYTRDTDRALDLMEAAAPRG